MVRLRFPGCYPHQRRGSQHLAGLVVRRILEGGGNHQILAVALQRNLTHVIDDFVILGNAGAHGREIDAADGFPTLPGCQGGIISNASLNGISRVGLTGVWYLIGYLVWLTGAASTAGMDKEEDKDDEERESRFKQFGMSVRANPRWKAQPRISPPITLCMSK